MSRPERYRIVKTFGPEFGLSTCYRQWRESRHCRLLHGYCLSFEITLEATELDERNWVFSFGEFDGLKKYLKENFDHTLWAARDDPQKDLLEQLHFQAVANVVWSDKIGAEAFAQNVYDKMKLIIALHPMDLDKRVKVVSVKCTEREGNSAIYFGPEE